MSTLSSTFGPIPTSLLRAILRPALSASSPALARTQLRCSSKVSLLDKLHRKQRKAIRQERLDSITRAAAMPSQTASTSKPTSTTTTPTSTDTASPHYDPANFATTTKTTSSQPSLSPAPSTPPSYTPYSITRTPAHQLPIYHLSKSGGNKHLTRVRKIDGDLNRLKSDIREVLGLEDYVIDRMGRKKENVAINWTTKQIMVRGWRRPELVKWAETMGF